MRRSGLILVVGGAGLLWLGCGRVSHGETGAAGASASVRPHELQDWVDSPVTVQFRRGLLGAHGDLPISPTTHSTNGAATCVRGKLRRVSERGVLVAGGQLDYWVPQEIILLVERRR